MTAELRRLQLWAAVNTIRTRALLKATGVWHTSLLVCGRQLAQVDAADRDGRMDPKFATFLESDTMEWLLPLARFASKAEELQRVQRENIAAFDRNVFKTQMEVVMECFFRPLEELWDLGELLLDWHWPWLSGVVFASLLLVAWHDMVAFALPLLLLLNVFLILSFRSLFPNGLDGPGPEWLRRAEEDDSAAAHVASTLDQLLDRFRRLKDTLGRTQMRMHRWNMVLLKMRSLYTWQEPSRTRLVVAGNVAAVLVFSVVPFRLLFAAFTCFLFAKPLRDPGPGPATRLMERFMDGLPVPSAPDAIYNPRPVPPPTDVSEVRSQIIGDRRWRQLVAS